MIGGNIEGVIQIRTTQKNEIGESIKIWHDTQTIPGWLDLMGGDARYNTYNAKIEESSHLFICDYVQLDPTINSENARMIIENEIYDVKLIDDPMKLHQQLEIYLSYTGGRA